MGLFDKIKQSLTPPDHAAVIAEKIAPERYLSHIVGMPSATDDNRRTKIPRDLTDVAQAAAHKMTDKYIEDKHIVGDEGSVARSLPRDSTPIVIALADGSLSMWSFGVGGRKNDPELVARVPRQMVAAVNDTGKRGVRGHVRFSFTDGSHFDYQTLAAPSEQFWATAQQYGAAPGHR